MLQWLFSCLKPDPSKANVKTAIKISQHEDEDRLARQEIEKDEQVEIKKAVEESLKLSQEKEEQRILEEESKEKGKGKQVDEKRKLTHRSKSITPPSLCKGCKSEIEDGINAFGALWHLQCLCCLHCHQPIDVHKVSKLKRQFHKRCYKEHCHPVCYVCDKKLPRTEEGIKYHEHPFWKEKYCPAHDHDRTAKCCSCERLESCGTTYVMLADGRRLCRECMECALMDTDECVSLHIDIREFFNDLNMKVEKEFHLFLVEKEALNKAEKEENIDNPYGIVTRGICLSEEQIVTSITKRPRMGPNKQLIDMVTETHTVTGCDVTAILILYGLPRVLTGYILAHEMMHAWLRLNGYRNLNMVLEEGLCQVLAYMWLEPQRFATPDATTSTAAASSSTSFSRISPAATTSKKGDQSDFVKRLVEFCKYQIETDDSPVYGLGFKKVNRMMLSNNHDIKHTLRKIANASKTSPTSNN